MFDISKKRPCYHLLASKQTWIQGMRRGWVVKIIQTPVGVQFVDVGFDFIVVGTNKILVLMNSIVQNLKYLAFAPTGAWNLWNYNFAIWPCVEVLWSVYFTCMYVHYFGALRTQNVRSVLRPQVQICCTDEQKPTEQPEQYITEVLRRPSGPCVLIIGCRANNPLNLSTCRVLVQIIKSTSWFSSSKVSQKIYVWVVEPQGFTTTM